MTTTIIQIIWIYLIWRRVFLYLWQGCVVQLQVKNGGVYDGILKTNSPRVWENILNNFFYFCFLDQLVYFYLQN